MHRSVKLAAAAAVLIMVGVAGGGGPTAAPDDGKINVVASTAILADVVGAVAGDAANVTGLIPQGKDPHEHELGLRAVRDIAYADAAFTNGLLLEPRTVAHTIDATVRDDVRVTEVTDRAQRYGFAPRMLVEDAGLDAPWLGLRVAAAEAPKTTVADFTLTRIDGPGNAAAYIVGTFGTPEVLFNSADGIGAEDTATLPMDAHTHVSWSFSQPGVYRLTLAAQTRPEVGAAPTPLGDMTVTVAVGVDPQQAGETVLDHGHVDIAADLAAGTLVLRGDEHDYDPATTVVGVPGMTLREVPSIREYRFLGEPGDETYVLPQAVLGKHVHGEYDPHFWHDAQAMKAVVKVVRDELSGVDPANAATYAANAQRYLAELDAVDREMRETVEAIPPERRNLVTTHDGFGYLADAYGLNVAGYISPNPNVEPSPRDILAVTRTLENLGVPAVFTEPHAHGQSTSLAQVAGTAGVEVCTLWGDTLEPPAVTYVELMQHNARTLASCLGDAGPLPVELFDAPADTPNQPTHNHHNHQH